MFLCVQAMNAPTTEPEGMMENAVAVGEDEQGETTPGRAQQPPAAGGERD